MPEKIFVGTLANQETMLTNQSALKKKLDELYYNMVEMNPVFGFIEHNDILDPETRIEYVGANKDYTPITVNMGGGYSLGSWKDHPWLKSNRPYMVKRDGTPDYELSAEDYTKKVDGETPSDVENEQYDGAGAFSWCQKVYKREYMSGSDRVVLFCMTKRDGFEPIGFVDPDGKELEGFWIPMFYGAISNTDSGGEKNNGQMRSISGMQPCHDIATDAQKTAIELVGTRAKFFGGVATQTLVDLEILFAKTTDLQKAYGKGNCNGYNSAGQPTYGVLPNAVVTGGQFYGTDDTKSLNKIFHSIVLGSYQIWCRDPYMLQTDDRFKVSLGYNLDLTGASYVDTGIIIDPNCRSSWDAGNNAMDYPSYYRTIPGFGSLPAGSLKGGSTTTGGCDGQWLHKPGVTPGFIGVFLRFGSCVGGLTCGGRSLTSNSVAAYAYWGYGAALLLLPPVGTAV